MTPRERCEQQAREWLVSHSIVLDAYLETWNREKIKSLTDLFLATERAVLEEVMRTVCALPVESGEKSRVIVTIADWCYQQAEERT